MNIEEEIKKFIKENLEIKVRNYESNCVTIGLYLQGERFSDCYVYIPDEGGSI